MKRIIHLASLLLLSFFHSVSADEIIIKHTTPVVSAPEIELDMMVDQAKKFYPEKPDDQMYYVEIELESLITPSF